MTTRAKKDDQLKALSEAFGKAQAVVVTDYRGHTVAELAQVRSQLRPQQVVYTIAKNTLTRRALQSLGRPDPGPLLDGPSALAFLMGDLQEPARTILALSRARKPLVIKGMLLGNSANPATAVEQLATLPPRPQLYAQVVGGVASPVVGLLSVLQSTVAGLAYVLQARVTQLGG